ncbi:heat shock factor protein-like protein [Sarcoptes scabiei]|uniref:Heat shock factor protein-like protein n=1 Tax=Sarcoptes scabiei TaxID=52283 RepID=A0A132AH33_SARSC|nr:heat shock factor protein-like protein [Sarcoptes scabiei]
MQTLESAVPTFIMKLWKLMLDRSDGDLNGRSFLIKNQTRFAKEILPLYFKHNGFRKLTNIESGLRADVDEVEFYHHYFSNGHEDQLKLIKRKMPTNPKSIPNSIVKVDDVSYILSDVEMIKNRQDSVDNMLTKIKAENEALWREIAILRQKHLKQQQIVEKLLQFLLSIVRKRVVGGIKRKGGPYLIDANNCKIIKNKDGNSICLAPSSSSNASNDETGPIIHELTDLEDPPIRFTSTNTPMNDSNLLINGLKFNYIEPNGQQAQYDSSNSKDDFNAHSFILPSDLEVNGDSTNKARSNISEVESENLSVVIPSNQIIAITPTTNALALNDLTKNQMINTLATSSLNTPQISLIDQPHSPIFITSVESPYTPSSKENDIEHPSIETSTVSTDLILPAKSNNPTTTIVQQPKLKSDYLNFNDHVEDIDNELSFLQDQLSDTSLNLDPLTILNERISLRGMSLTT